MQPNLELVISQFYAAGLEASVFFYLMRRRSLGLGFRNWREHVCNGWAQVSRLKAGGGQPYISIRMV